jgi:hypothetical protein
LIECREQLYKRHGLAILFTFPEIELLNGIIIRVSWHKLESSLLRVAVWFSALEYPLYKRLCMSRPEFSRFVDIFVSIFNTRVEYSFSVILASTR